MLEEADRWSQVPHLLNHYLSLIDTDDGIMRFFGYASLIDRHETLKPQSSKTLPNERARLQGMEVSMNLRVRKLFAGLEMSEGKHAEGVNITVLKDDRQQALIAFLRRELGDPPWGVGIKDVIGNSGRVFAKVKDTPQDQLERYKLQIVRTDIATFDATKKVYALAVVTNAALPSSLVGASAEHLATLLLEDSQSLEYFVKDAIEPARRCGMRQVRLEAIERALEVLSE